MFYLTLTTQNNAKKSMPFRLARQICIIVVKRKVRKTHLDKLRKVLYSKKSNSRRNSKSNN